MMRLDSARHSWTHADLTLLPDADVRAEIAESARIVPQQVAGTSNKPYFRSPYGLA
jgi:peptidoglycan/xylan/chitin deacetylase (PgdA/CDA1 family)